MVAPVVLAAMIGAASSLGGGLLSARRRRIERREDMARQDNQLQRLMADAGLAGIHPVAAMGMSGDYARPVGSADVFGDAISEAGGRVSDFVLAQQDFAISAQHLELERMRLENEARSFALAEAQSRSILSGIRAAVSDGGVFDARQPALLVNPVGQDTVLPPSMSAQQAEDRWGEPGEWAMAIANIIRDLLHQRGMVAQDYFDIPPLLPDWQWGQPVRGDMNPGGGAVEVIVPNPMMRSR